MIITTVDYLLENNIKTTEIVGKRLKALIKREIKNGKYSSQQDFFEKINTRIMYKEEIENVSTDIANRNVYNKYLSGKTNMNLFVLKEICLELNCTADYLLGISPINKNFLGSAYKVLFDLGYDVTTDYEDNLLIKYRGKEIELDYEELQKEIENLFEYQLFKKLQK